MAIRRIVQRQNRPLARGSVVSVFAGGKWRRAVVLVLVGDTEALVAWATGTDRRPDYRAVPVHHLCADGRRLDLEKESYFYGCNATKVPLAELQIPSQDRGLCSVALIIDLQELIADAVEESGT
jgi:hypothetical protein